MREPTRVTVNFSSIIDHIATDFANSIIKSLVHELSFSDHFMVYFIRKLNGAIKKDHRMIISHKMNSWHFYLMLLA